MILRKLFIILIFTLLIGCAAKQDRIVYIRTKDVRSSGTMTAMKDSPLFSITWKYATENNMDKNTTEALLTDKDCFKSELFYDGISNKKIMFLIKNYTCSVGEPVSVEQIIIDKTLNTSLYLHDVIITILEADPNKILFQIEPN